ncbi:MAG: glycerol-3-phosphate acyltransferase [Actinomycetota bacterium]|nr:glycerol-3-phosphate acyltransferase [Actinomycetota bacterium]
MKGARLAAAATLGYLMGTAPSADLACRLAGGGATDLRAVGSRNPGANNVGKLLGKRWGYGVMAADIAKGALACGAGRAVAGPDGSHVAGVGAVVGHCYPLWSGFRGGKGVATSVGQCAATFPVWSVVDLLVAWAAAEAPRRRWYGSVDDARWWRRRHVGATVVSSSAWVAASTLWWRRGWPNLWGPRPSAALPLAAAATSAVILLRFATEPPPLAEGPPDEGPPPDGGDREPLVPVPTLPSLEAEAALS